MNTIQHGNLKREVKAEQNTLLKSVTYETRNSGLVTIGPADADSGICFVRRDKIGNAGMIVADWRNASGNEGNLDLVNGDGVSVRKVSGLLAALKMSGIDNAIVEVEAETLDIGGSGFAGLLTALEKCGRQRQRGVGCEVTLGKCAAVEAGGSSAIALPAGRLIVELYVENSQCERGWCLVIFDENLKSAVESGDIGDYGFGIHVKGGDLPPELVYGQMLAALGLLALCGAYRDIQLRGINFTLEIGLRLLKLVDR